MSIGFGAHANRILEDEETVVYEFGGFNWNDPKYYNEERILDGLITIQKECFIEPEIDEKLKRMPSGKRRLVKRRRPAYVEYRKLLKEGLIKIDNCSNCWQVTENELAVDIMAYRLLFCIFRDYQKEGKIPEIIDVAF